MINIFTSIVHIGEDLYQESQ